MNEIEMLEEITDILMCQTNMLIGVMALLAVLIIYLLRRGRR